MVKRSLFVATEEQMFFLSRDVKNIPAHFQSLNFFLTMKKKLLIFSVRCWESKKKKKMKINFLQQTFSSVCSILNAGGISIFWYIALWAVTHVAFSVLLPPVIFFFFLFFFHPTLKAAQFEALTGLAEGSVYWKHVVRHESPSNKSCFIFNFYLHKHSRAVHYDYLWGKLFIFEVT